MAHVENRNQLWRFINFENQAVGLEYELAKVGVQVFALAGKGAPLWETL